MIVVSPPAGSLVLKGKAPYVVIAPIVWRAYDEPSFVSITAAKIVSTARGPPVYTTDNTFNRSTFLESSSVRGSL